MTNGYRLKSRPAEFGLGGLGLAARRLCGRSSDRLDGQLGLNLSARAGNGWFWRHRRRSRRLECRLRQCRHVAAAVPDDTAARMTDCKSDCSYAAHWHREPSESLEEFKRRVQADCTSRSSYSGD